MSLEGIKSLSVSEQEYIFSYPEIMTVLNVLGTKQIACLGWELVLRTDNGFFQHPKEAIIGFSTEQNYDEANSNFVSRSLLETKATIESCIQTDTDTYPLENMLFCIVLDEK
ncbi:hypothetical protein [Vibrio diabolicus]|uniref:hypothetical protein n=1 Tax=Vibrio diabolicus TaxID=50719 RepID=UPI0038CD8023